MRAILAMDIGGTNTRIVIADANTGNEIQRRVLPSVTGSYTDAVRQISDAATTLATGHYLRSACVSVAGSVKDGVIIGAGNLVDWIGHDLRADLCSRLDRPIAVINDAVAAAYGESTALTNTPFTYIIWGTGVGGATVSIVDHQPVVTPIEPGHAIIDINSSMRCGCGGLGHLEALVGGGCIPKRRFGDLTGLTAPQLDDDQWRGVLMDMAVGLRCVTSLTPNSGVIVMGGGVATKQARRLPLLESLVRQLPSSVPPPSIRRSVFGDDSGIVGAALVARKMR